MTGSFGNDITPPMFAYILKATGPSQLGNQKVTVVSRKAFRSRELAEAFIPEFRAKCLEVNEVTGIEQMLRIDKLETFIILIPDEITPPIPETARKLNPLSEIAFRLSKLYTKMDGMDKRTPGVVGAKQEKTQIYLVSAMLYALGRKDYLVAKRLFEQLCKVDAPLDRSVDNILGLE